MSKFEKPGGSHEQVSYIRLEGLAKKDPWLYPLVSLLSPHPIAAGLPNVLRQSQRNPIIRGVLDRAQRDPVAEDTLRPIIDELQGFRAKLIDEVVENDPFVCKARSLLETTIALLNHKGKSPLTPLDKLLINARAQAEVAQAYGADVFQRISRNELHGPLDQFAAVELQRKPVKYEIFEEKTQEEEKAQKVLFNALGEFSELQINLFRETLRTCLRGENKSVILYQIGEEAPEILETEALIAFNFMTTLHPSGPTASVSIRHGDTDVVIAGGAPPKTPSDIFATPRIARELNYFHNGIMDDGKLKDEVMLATRATIAIMIGHIMWALYKKDKAALFKLVPKLQSLERLFPEHLKIDPYNFHNLVMWYSQMKGAGFIADREQKARKLGLPDIFDLMPQCGPRSRYDYEPTAKISPSQTAESVQSQPSVTQEIIRNSTKKEKSIREKDKVLRIEGTPAVIRSLDAWYLPTDTMIEKASFQDVTEIPGDASSTIRLTSEKPVITADGFFYIPFHSGLTPQHFTFYYPGGRVIPSTQYTIQLDNSSEFSRVAFSTRAGQEKTVHYQIDYGRVPERKSKKLPAPLQKLEQDKLVQANDKLRESGLVLLADAIEKAHFEKTQSELPFTLSDLENVFISEADYSYSTLYRLRVGAQNPIEAISGFLNQTTGRLQIQCDAAATLYASYLNDYLIGTDLTAEPIFCRKVPIHKDRSDVAYITEWNNHARVAITQGTRVIAFRDTTPFIPSHLPDDLPVTVFEVIKDTKNKADADRKLVEHLSYTWRSIQQDRDVAHHLRQWVNADPTDPLAASHHIVTTLQNVIDGQHVAVPQLERFSSGVVQGREDVLRLLQERTTAAKRVLDYQKSQHGSTPYNHFLPSDAVMLTERVLDTTSQTLKYLQAGKEKQRS